MTLQTQAAWMFPDPHVGMAGGITFGSFLIDATAEKFSVIFRVPKTGNIRKIGYLTGTVNTGDTVNVGLQTLTAGFPSGTAYGGMTAGTQVILSTNDNTWFTTTLTVDAAATAGDYVAAVIDFTAFVAGSINFQVINPTSATSISFPYVAQYTASWAAGPFAPVLYIEYDDGSSSFVPGLYPYSALADTSYNTGSTPDEYALRFNLPFPVEVSGFWGWIGGTGNYDIVLYEGTTSKTSMSIVAANHSTGSARWVQERLTTPFQTAANTTYYLSVKPTSATNVTVNIATLGLANAAAQMAGGTECYRGSRTDAGAWTDTTTSRPLIGIFSDQFDDGAGGGGGGGRLVSGSLAG